MWENRCRKSPACLAFRVRASSFVLDNILIFNVICWPQLLKTVYRDPFQWGRFEVKPGVNRLLPFTGGHNLVWRDHLSTRGSIM